MGSGGGPPPVPFTVAMTGEGGFFRLVDPLSFLLLHSRAPGIVSVPPGGPARPPVETRPPRGPSPYYIPGGGRGGNKQRRRSSRPRPAASLPSRSQAGWMGGPRPPGLHPQVSAQGGAAHLVPSSSAARLQGSAAGARSRPPRDSLRSFSLPRTSSAQLSAWPRPGRARRNRHLVFPPGIGPISARA
ncbi:hypothetical protein NDU88_003134 [Pleurodeles waltl]|uniref:Basic proline-rich protein-like n=1 Tax=Pleurodeles waltl TaxID=8319 RepID=A0AAV7QAX7_PLEWA|nr:hypothetical protein NDU88_003134 [Pleurodeles waltl]